MISISSLEAQSQFGSLLDRAQREPITITRRGRAVAVLMSMADYQEREGYISATVAKAISEQLPARGETAELMLKRLYDALKESRPSVLSEEQMNDIINSSDAE